MVSLVIFVRFGCSCQRLAFIIRFILVIKCDLPVILIEVENLYASHSIGLYLLQHLYRDFRFGAIQSNLNPKCF